jgi:hypothetical protein
LVRSARFFAVDPGVTKVNYDERGMDPELKQYLEAMEDRLNTRVEKVETNLLTAFHGWARSMEIRVRGVSTVTTGFDERLAHVEERVSELERKKAS